MVKFVWVLSFCCQLPAIVKSWSKLTNFSAYIVTKRTSLLSPQFLHLLFILHFSNQYILPEGPHYVVGKRYPIRRAASKTLEAILAM